MSREKCKYYLTEPYQGGGIAVTLQPGQTLLDRFTIRSSLGSGSLGTVYLAFDTIKSKEVALKVVTVASESAADRLKREIELNSRVVEYRHVVRVYDIHATTWGGIVLLLVSMECADGGSLRQWLLEHKDDIHSRQSTGVRLVVQACQGVRALHDAGIVHQDLKPENLLLVHGGVKVSDLSLSRYVHDTSAGDCRDARHESPRPPGTPAYMSPEQFAAPHPADVDCRSDIYSLGIILFETCHPQCRPPFGGSYQRLRECHLNVPAPRLENAGANESRVVAKCLQKRPMDRYATIADLVDDLEGRWRQRPTPVAEVTTESQTIERAAGLWQQAREFMFNKNLDEAQHLCTEILSLSVEHDEAKRMLEDIQNRYQQAQQCYGKIERGIGYQSLDELLALLQEAVDIYPNHPDGRLVQTQLLALSRQYDDVIHKGLAAVGDGQWQVAQANFERARQINPGSPGIVRLVEFVSEIRVQVETTRNGIDAALEEGNRRKALFLARGLDEYVRHVRGSVC